MTSFLKITLLTLVLAFTVNAQNLTFNYTTKMLPYNKGYEFSPEHVFAIWVEDANGKFVNTIAMYGFIRNNYLETWHSKSGGFTEDGMTGATLTSHIPQSFEWNLKSYIGRPVANGEYKLCFEYTSRNAQGPIYRFPITITGENFTLTPTDKEYLTDISIAYNSGITSTAEVTDQQKYLKVTPNPVSNNSILTLVQPFASDVTIKLITVSGKELDQKQVSAQSGENSFQLEELFGSIPSGVLFIVAETKSYTLTQKIINQ